MVDIGQRMRELIAVLRKGGVNGVRMPDVRPECEAGWTQSYALIRDVYPDITHEFYGDSEIQYRSDVEEFVRNFFAPSVIVKFFWRSQEIEVSVKETHERN